MEKICFKSVNAILVTLNISKTLQGSIVRKNWIKLFEEVIDFYEVRVYNQDIFTNLSRSIDRQ